jgi:hypothetical protein
MFLTLHKQIQAHRMTNVWDRHIFLHFISRLKIIIYSFRQTKPHIVITIALLSHSSALPPLNLVCSENALACKFKIIKIKN